MSLHRNRVQMTVTGAPGTGTITLNAATTGYQSFSSAYGADATVDILITEGNNWEVCRNCAYTNGTPQVDRGTLEGSSAGPTTRVSFGSGAVVSVIATAASGNNWGLNQIDASPTGAGVTGVVGTMHILDISGLTGDQDFTLPATCAIGDRVGVFLKVGDADHELSLKPASGDTINGGSPAAEWSRLFITGECVIFRCIAADTDWIVEYDGRIPQYGEMSLTADCDGEASNTTTLPTSAATPGTWTAGLTRGLTYTGATGRFTVRRESLYQVAAGARAKDGTAGGVDAIFSTSILDSGAEIRRSSAITNASTVGPVVATLAVASSGDYFQMAYLTSTGGLGCRGAAGLTFLTVAEVLP
jgi:hypothetical protein